MKENMQFQEKWEVVKYYLAVFALCHGYN